MVARGKNWSTAEDSSLCSAFLRVSNNSIEGADQSGEVLWNRVWKQFVELCPNHQHRDVNKLSKRWYNCIQPTIGKFSGVFARVKREMASGESYSDILSKTIENFKLEYKKEFALQHCWELLRNEEKFNPDADDPLEIVTSPSALSNITSNAHLGRPRGAKRSLEDSREQKYRRTLGDQLKSIADAMAKRNAVIKEAAEVALFNCIDDDMSRRYFDLKRRKVIDRLEKEAVECGSNSPSVLRESHTSTLEPEVLDPDDS
jgi:hypothetical protein